MVTTRLGVALAVIVAFHSMTGGLAVGQAEEQVQPTTKAPGVTDADKVEPGNTGRGSEKNSQVAPTSPEIPTHSQPPPEINLPAGGDSSGAVVPDSAPDSGATPKTK